MYGEEPTQGVVDQKQVGDFKRRRERDENRAENAEQKQKAAEAWEAALAYINSGIPPESL